MIQLYEGETITKTIRRHWFIVATDIVMFLFFALVPLFGITMFLNAVTKGGGATDYGAFIAFFYLVWLEFSWIMFAVTWTTNYYLDVVLITNRRLLKVEQKGLFARDIAEMRLERIQDISVDIMGLIPSLLNFGDLKVQTAGEEEAFVISDIPDPNGIKNTIFEHHDDPQGPVTKQGL
ncbi:MAG: PH domain-containing protein [Parcubacteria group bacterium]|nr:PH domain-containing protein [Parcubacteria group bacterium]